MILQQLEEADWRAWTTTARVELAVTLRELGLGLADVRRVLDARASVAEVAAVHLEALNTQIRALRLRRAVLAAVKRAADGKEMTIMNKLARLSAAERRQIIDGFTAEVFDGLDSSPAGVRGGRRSDRPHPGQHESPGGAGLLAQVKVFTDPRIERYWQLTAIITGRRLFTPHPPGLRWLAAALRARRDPAR